MPFGSVGKNGKIFVPAGGKFALLHLIHPRCECRKFCAVAGEKFCPLLAGVRSALTENQIILLRPDYFVRADKKTAASKQGSFWKQFKTLAKPYFMLLALHLLNPLRCGFGCVLVGENWGKIRRTRPLDLSAECIAHQQRRWRSTAVGSAWRVRVVLDDGNKKSCRSFLI
jgi:hypothetical protein